MTKESPSSIPGARRAARIAAAAGLVAALAASGAAPVFAADAPVTTPVKPAATSDKGDKLGEADADVLAKAEAKGEKNITMMVATAPGATEQVTEQLDAVKGSVLGQTYDKLGYVRATVPTATAEATIKAAQKLSSVYGIDLKQEIKLDDPTPTGDRAAGAKQTKSTGSYPAPGKNTLGEEPVQPVLRDGRGRLRPAAPEGRRPRYHHRCPGLRCRHRAPGAAEDHHRRAQDRRLGDRHRPRERRRPHLAADDRGRGGSDVHHRRPHLLGAGGVLQDPDLLRGRHPGWRHGRGPEPGRRHHRQVGRALRPDRRYRPRRPERRRELRQRRRAPAVQGQAPGRLLRYGQPGDADRRAHPVRRRDPQGRRLRRGRRPRPTTSTSASSRASTARTSRASPRPTACSAAR